MKDLHNDHLVRFIGACLEPTMSCLVTEYCPRGSLQDILEDEDLTMLDDIENLKISLIHDIVKVRKCPSSGFLKLALKSYELSTSDIQ